MCVLGSLCWHPTSLRWHWRGWRGEQGCSTGSCCVFKCCSVGCREQRALVLVCRACSNVERACTPCICPNALHQCVGNAREMPTHAFPSLVRWDGCSRRLPKVL